MDEIPIEDVARFETELRDTFRSRHAALLDEIRSTGKLPEGDALSDAVTAFVESFDTAAVDA